MAKKAAKNLVIVESPAKAKTKEVFTFLETAR